MRDTIRVASQATSRISALLSPRPSAFSPQHTKGNHPIHLVYTHESMYVFIKLLFPLSIEDNADDSPYYGRGGGYMPSPGGSQGGSPGGAMKVLFLFSTILISF